MTEAQPPILLVTGLSGAGKSVALKALEDIGYEAVDNKMHIHDWHATVLALMGLDHERLTYRYAGRDFRLTDIHGRIAKEIFA